MKLGRINQTTTMKFVISSMITNHIIFVLGIHGRNYQSHFIFNSFLYVFQLMVSILCSYMVATYVSKQLSDHMVIRCILAQELLKRYLTVRQNHFKLQHLSSQLASQLSISDYIYMPIAIATQQCTYTIFTWLNTTAFIITQS